MENIDTAKWLEILQNLDPLYYVAMGATLILLIVLLTFWNIRAGKKRRARAVAPVFQFQNLLIAPLAKGVQIKLINTGHLANVVGIKIKKRQDLQITQGFTSFEVGTNKLYHVFCEAEGRSRADNGFDLVLDYKDQIGNLYRQLIHIQKDKNYVEDTKLIRYM